MSLKNIAILVLALSITNTAFASLITYNGYTLDTDTNIITDGEVEWLSWTLTDGMSMSTALTTFQSDGWEIANEDHVSGLMNDFFGDVLVWDNNAESNQFAWYAFQAGEDVNTDFALQFNSLFGVTWGNPNATDFPVQSNAYYNSDRINGVSVYSDSTYYGQSDGQLRLYASGISGGASSSWGVALVREAQSESTDVPEPGSLAVFGISILGLLRLKRK